MARPKTSANMIAPKETRHNVSTMIAAKDKNPLRQKSTKPVFMMRLRPVNIVLVYHNHISQNSKGKSQNCNSKVKSKEILSFDLHF
jgi:hypothetical protein